MTTVEKSKVESPVNNPEPSGDQIGSHRKPTTRDRYLGSMLGLATGDALGAVLEFSAPGTFKPIEDMAGGGPFGLKPGEWTDDTSMALCLADSLISKQGFDPIDQLQRFVRWQEEGYMSSRGRCFDIGNTTRNALYRFKESGEPFCGSTEPQTAGNGSLMRLAPVPLYFASRPENAIFYSGESSRTTHQANTAIDACRYMGALIVGAIQGASKEAILSEEYSSVPDYWKKHPLCREIKEIAGGSFKRKSPPQIRGTGHVVDSIEAALWAFYNGNTFEQGCLLAVNLGDDADTTGAVYGQLAGSFYGIESIPVEWKSKLAHERMIEEMAEHIYCHAFQAPR